jgi:uncharacterized protein with FMN-binding domain
MRQTILRRWILSLGMTALAGFPIGNAWASTQAAAPAARAQAAKSKTFKGPTEYGRHGPVQVSIVVKSKKIVKVTAAISPAGDGRSPFLQGRAIPILRQETLAAQSAKINVVSGATETSDGYIQSLQSAIHKARKAKALR